MHFLNIFLSLSHYREFLLESRRELSENLREEGVFRFQLGEGMYMLQRERVGFTALLIKELADSILDFWNFSF